MAYYRPSGAFQGIAQALQAIPEGFKRAEEEQKAKVAREQAMAEHKEDRSMVRGRYESEIAKEKAQTMKTEAEAKQKISDEEAMEFASTLTNFSRAAKFGQKDVATQHINNYFPGTEFLRTDKDDEDGDLYIVKGSDGNEYGVSEVSIAKMSTMKPSDILKHNIGVKQVRVKEAALKQKAESDAWKKVAAQSGLDIRKQELEAKKENWGRMAGIAATREGRMAANGASGDGNNAKLQLNTLKALDASYGKTLEAYNKARDNFDKTLPPESQAEFDKAIAERKKVAKQMKDLEASLGQPKAATPQVPAGYGSKPQGGKVESFKSNSGKLYTVGKDISKTYVENGQRYGVSMDGAKRIKLQ